MGLLDSLIDLPGKILEAGAETITSIPAAGISAIEGTIKGIEKGVERVMDKLED